MAATILNLYIVVPYLEKMATEVLPAGYRLSVIRWRETAAKSEAKQKPPAPRAVIVPEIPLVLDKPAALRNSLRAAIDKLQDDRIRDILNKHLEGEGNVLNITLRAEDIDESGIANFLAEESTGGRLSGDVIRAWFDSSIKEAIEAKLVARGADSKKVEQVTNQFRATFMKLASPVTPIPEPVLMKLTEVLAEMTADGASAVDEKIARAIEKRMPKNEEELLMEI